MSDVDARRLRRVLRQHVQTDSLLGVGWVPIREASRAAVVEGAGRVESGTDPAAAERGRTPPAKRSGSDASLRPAVGSFDDADEQLAAWLRAEPGAGQKAELLAALDAGQVTGCTKCELCKGRSQTVFGEGDADARLMFIGEGPGEQEDLTGRPFVGRAGQLLDKQIAATGLTREQVYIANVVKCRPTGNRNPSPAEAAQCFGYLRKQIAIVRPEVIITLGAPAARRVLQVDRGITAIRGQWHEYVDGPMRVAVMPTFHPAYLLRSYTRANREKVWHDLQQAMGKLGLDRGETSSR
jgi:DNA polymerase